MRRASLGVCLLLLLSLGCDSPTGDDDAGLDASATVDTGAGDGGDPDRCCEFEAVLPCSPGQAIGGRAGSGGCADNVSTTNDGSWNDTTDSAGCRVWEFAAVPGPDSRCCNCVDAGDQTDAGPESDAGPSGGDAGPDADAGPSGDDAGPDAGPVLTSDAGADGGGVIGVDAGDMCMGVGARCADTGGRDCETARRCIGGSDANGGVCVPDPATACNGACAAAGQMCLPRAGGTGGICVTAAERLCICSTARAREIFTCGSISPGG